MTNKILSAGDFAQSLCKKCKKATKHIIVGLVDGVPAKVQCTECKSNHGYRIGPTPTAGSHPRAPQKKTESQDWLVLSEKWDEHKSIPYDNGGVFKKGDLISHAHFGLGVIMGPPNYKKMKVLFREGEKLLLCANR